jgi:hypothetical protein
MKFGILIFGILTLKVLTVNVIDDKMREDYNYIIKIGTSNDNLNFDVDTTSPVTWLFSRYVNNTNSTSLKALNKTLSLSKQLTGTLYNETFNFGNLEAEAFNFMSIDKEAYKGYKDGSLGLGFYSKPSQYSILDYLNQTGKTKYRVFQISYTGDTNKSIVLDLGNMPSGLNSYSFTNITEPGFLAKYPNAWIVNIYHLLKGQEKELNSSTYINQAAIIDSTNNYIIAPISYKEYFRNYLDPIYNTSCKFDKIENGEIILCSDDVILGSIESLTFLLSNTGYKYYAKDLFDRYDDGNYEFLIKFGNDNYWHLGVPFLKKYTTLFNADLKHIGFKGGHQIDYTTECNEYLERYNKKFMNYIVVVGATALAGFLLLVIIFLIVRSYKRKRLSAHGPLIEEVK